MKFEKFPWLKQGLVLGGVLLSWGVGAQVNYPINEAVPSIGGRIETYRWTDPSFCNAENGSLVGSNYSNSTLTGFNSIPSILVQVGAKTSAKWVVPIPAGVTRVAVSAQSQSWGDTMLGVSYDGLAPPGDQASYLGFNWLLFPKINGAAPLPAGYVYPTNTSFATVAEAWFMNFSSTGAVLGNPMVLNELSVTALVKDAAMFKQWLQQKEGICGGSVTPTPTPTSLVLTPKTGLTALTTGGYEAQSNSSFSVGVSNVPAGVVPSCAVSPASLGTVSSPAADGPGSTSYTVNVTNLQAGAEGTLTCTAGTAPSTAIGPIKVSAPVQTLILKLDPGFHGVSPNQYVNGGSEIRLTMVGSSTNGVIWSQPASCTAKALTTVPAAEIGVVTMPVNPAMNSGMLKFFTPGITSTQEAAGAKLRIACTTPEGFRGEYEVSMKAGQREPGAVPVLKGVISENPFGIKLTFSPSNAEKAQASRAIFWIGAEIFVNGWDVKVPQLLLYRSTDLKWVSLVESGGLLPITVAKVVERYDGDVEFSFPLDGLNQETLKTVKLKLFGAYQINGGQLSTYPNPVIDCTVGMGCTAVQLER